MRSLLGSKDELGVSELPLNLIRGFQARKKYIIPPLKNTIVDKIYSAGNDPFPDIPDQLKSNASFIFVGTSCLRSLYFATLFCAPNSTFIPKIIIVDNNSNVKIFWKIIQGIFEACNSLEEVKQNIAENKNIMKIIFHGDALTENELNKKYAGFAGRMCLVLDNAFDSFQRSFLRLKKTVQNLIVFTQDWTDIHVFRVIKNIAHYHDKKIYCYSSNILSCIDANGCLFNVNPRVDLILKNTALLAPIASLYANYSFSKKSPDKMFCYEGSGDPEKLRQDVGSRGAKKKYIKELVALFTAEYESKNFPAALVYIKKAYNEFCSLQRIDIIQGEASTFYTLRYNLSWAYFHACDINNAFRMLFLALVLCLKNEELIRYKEETIEKIAEQISQSQLRVSQKRIQLISQLFPDIAEKLLEEIESVLRPALLSWEIEKPKNIDVFLLRNQSSAKYIYKIMCDENLINLHADIFMWVRDDIDVRNNFERVFLVACNPLKLVIIQRYFEWRMRNETDQSIDHLFSKHIVGIFRINPRLVADFFIQSETSSLAVKQIIANFCIVVSNEFYPTVLHQVIDQGLIQDSVLVMMLRCFEKSILENIFRIAENFFDFYNQFRETDPNKYDALAKINKAFVKKIISLMPPLNSQGQSSLSVVEINVAKKILALPFSGSRFFSEVDADLNNHMRCLGLSEGEALLEFKCAC